MSETSHEVHSDKHLSLEPKVLTKNDLEMTESHRLCSEEQSSSPKTVDIMKTTTNANQSQKRLCTKTRVSKLAESLYQPRYNRQKSNTGNGLEIQGLMKAFQGTKTFSELWEKNTHSVFSFYDTLAEMC